jgi:uncharacterized protein involved in outer membrane biogenesis
MLKKIIVAVAVGVVLVAIGAAVWARSILATDTVRNAIAAQVSQAIGQPVTIGGIGASVFPRVTINLDKVTIGQPAKIAVETLHVGTNFRALLSRRIEHGSLRLSGTRVELPLPPLATGSEAPESTAGAGGGSPVEIVSIDEILLNDVEIVSGGRTLRGDIDAAVDGETIVLRSVTLSADDTAITATGKITDPALPAGEIEIKAGALNLDRLLAFANDFSGGVGTSSQPAARPAARATNPSNPAANLTLVLNADRASMGGMTIENVTGRATLIGSRAVIDPIAFNLFGGSYKGTVGANLAGAAPTFRWTAALAGIDVAAATAFAGSPNVVSGRLSGAIDLTGTGADAATAIKSARGTATIAVVDGVVKKLGLVRNVVIATSGREGATKQAMTGGSTDEPFTRLSATMQVAGGVASTDDLRFESKDLLLSAAGTVRTDGSAVDIRGRVQLSDELTRQAGSDLTRYTADQGRVTLPATITGPADNLSVRIDIADMAKRAITNRATEEAQKRLKSGLGGLLRRP